MKVIKTFENFNAESEQMENIARGYNCKNCNEKIDDRQKWGNSVLCEKCENAVIQSVENQ